MQKLIATYEKQYGYKPSVQELYSLYTQGELTLTDEQEDELLSKLN